METITRASGWVNARLSYLLNLVATLDSSVVKKVANKSPSPVDGNVNLTTTDIPEGLGLYYTATRVLSATLTTLNTAANSVVTATDSVITGIGKLQAQITALSASVTSSLSNYLPKVGGTAYGTKFVGYVEQLQALNPGAAVTINTVDGTLIEISTTANINITLPSSVAGVSYTIIIIYGGAHTVTFTPTGTFSWTGGSAPVATMVAGKKDKYFFTCGTGYTIGQDGGRNA